MTVGIGVLRTPAGAVCSRARSDVRLHASLVGGIRQIDTSYTAEGAAELISPLAGIVTTVSGSAAPRSRTSQVSAGRPSASATVVSTRRVHVPFRSWGSASAARAVAPARRVLLPERRPDVGVAGSADDRWDCGRRRLVRVRAVVGLPATLRSFRRPENDDPGQEAQLTARPIRPAARPRHVFQSGSPSSTRRRPAFPTDETTDAAALVALAAFGTATDARPADSQARVTIRPSTVRLTQTARSSER
jgi:hypothetical protein